MTHRFIKTTPLACVVLAATLVIVVQAGDLNPPPGPVTPTMKTLTEVEPRTAVQTLLGSETALHVISQSGSYYLTGNINGVSGKNGIEITADNVTLDLTGFTLMGVEGSLTGIAVPASHQALTISGGVLRNWGQNGIGAPLVTIYQISAIHAIENGADGINIGSFANKAVPANGTIESCRLAGNGDAGVRTAGSVIVRGCTALFNAGDGIRVKGGSVVTECTATSNGANGIASIFGAVVIRQCGLAVNGLSGIRIDTDSFVADNTLTNNGVGIRVTGGRNRIEGNNSVGGTGIIVDIGGNIIVKNSVSASTPYNIAAGNIVGPITSDPTTTSPWANFIY